MSYEDIIHMISITKKTSREAYREKRQLRKDFKKHGWYDEDLAEDLCARADNLYETVNILIARLPELASL